MKTISLFVFRPIGKSRCSGSHLLAELRTLRPCNASLFPADTARLHARPPYCSLCFDGTKLGSENECSMANVSPHPSHCHHSCSSPLQNNQARKRNKGHPNWKGRGKILCLQRSWSSIHKVLKDSNKRWLEPIKEFSKVPGNNTHTLAYPWSNRRLGTPSPRTCSRCAPSPGRWTRASSPTGFGWNTLQPAHQWMWRPGRGKGGGTLNPSLQRSGRISGKGDVFLLPISGLILVKEKEQNPGKLMQKSPK